MFRKSHLLPTAANQFNPSKQLTKADVKIFSWGVLVSIRWSKTIQFRERVVDIPLPSIPGSALCPTSAITNAFRFTAQASTRGSQVFNWVDGSHITHVFTYSAFVSKLRSHLVTLGVDPKLYTGHLFRRGGASFAYQSGVPIELIKALGDWRSDTILIYLTMPLTMCLHSANMLCKAILLYT